MKQSQFKRVEKIYQTSLRTYCGQSSHTDPQEGLQAAHAFGAEALESGLDTLDLARIHDQAMQTLLSNITAADTRAELTRRAEVFFAEAIIPVEGTHRIALEASASLKQLYANLEQRTLDLADSKNVLLEQIAGRRKSEASLRISEEASSQLLKDSRVLEKHLQEMVRKVLSANEAERKRMSLQLNDEIAQSLLAINLRMLALKKEVAANHADLTREIAITQRLVEDSAKIIRHLADEFSI